eukprot:2070172-Alexandrium_andersonii.AAC.1
MLLHGQGVAGKWACPRGGLWPRRSGAIARAPRRKSHCFELPRDVSVCAAQYPCRPIPAGTEARDAPPH